MRRETVIMLAEKLSLEDLLEPDIANITRNRNNWTKDFKAIVDTAIQELERVQPVKEEQRKLIEALLISISFKYGGKGLYLPQANRVKVAIRNYWIYQDSKEMTPEQLANQYRLSVTGIYSILKEQKKIEALAHDPGNKA